LTHSDAKEIQRFGCPPEKIRIIPNGVDTEKFKPCERTIENSIFWGGRFVQEKGLEYLVNALSLVVKEVPRVKLVMAGDGPLFSKIYEMVKHNGLEKNVSFKGRVAHDELPAFIGASSVCVLPSLREGMPYALLEAMSCGKAVVGSDIPGINDVITHGINGILVPPKDSKALADAIIWLLEDKEFRMKMGQNARQLMIEKYSWRNIAEKIDEIYYEAINKKLAK
jgi:glycosyltransferase involved in cell wall biosynthesis